MAFLRSLGSAKHQPSLQRRGYAQQRNSNLLYEVSRPTFRRPLANIENQGAIPSLPVIIQLIKVCGLPVERYFTPEIMLKKSEQWQRDNHKLFQLRNFNLKHVLLFGILYIKRPISCIRQFAEGVVLIDFANPFFQFSGSLLGYAPPG